MTSQAPCDHRPVVWHRGIAGLGARTCWAPPAGGWPQRPVIPEEWVHALSPWLRAVRAAIGEGFCPKHLLPLGEASCCGAGRPKPGWCMRCEAWWWIRDAPGTPLCGASWLEPVTERSETAAERYVTG
jgi:hypothetical protein